MKIYLKGNYYNNFIKLDVFRTKKVTSNVFLNVHGLYGLSGDTGSKSKLLGKSILEDNIANVVHFSSSRDWSIFDDKDRDLGLKAFQDKTFNQERQDLLDTLDLLYCMSKDLFDVDDIKFYIVANSLGGTITSSISEKFNLVDKIILCGSGTGASSPSKPILSTYPSKEYVKKSASKFTGEVMLLQGSKDDVVPIFSQDELIASYSGAKFNIKKVIEGANHNFSSINGKNKKMAYKLYCDEVINFIKD